MDKEMQTFLPVPNFIESAKVLDYRRLGKQRVECYQILRSLSGESSGWKNHPAVRMWEGYEEALRQYQRAMILEWINRGYRNTLSIPVSNSYVLPKWFGDDSFHASHRSNLLRKNPVWYGQWGWKEPNDIPYKWPV